MHCYASLIIFLQSPGILCFTPAEHELIVLHLTIFPQVHRCRPQGGGSQGHLDHTLIFQAQRTVISAVIIACVSFIWHLGRPLWKQTMVTSMLLDLLYSEFFLWWEPSIHRENHPDKRRKPISETVDVKFWSAWSVCYSSNYTQAPLSSGM